MVRPSVSTTLVSTSATAWPLPSGMVLWVFSAGDGSSSSVDSLVQIYLSAFSYDDHYLFPVGLSG